MYRVEAVEKVPAETDLSEAEGDVDNATDENMDNLDNEVRGQSKRKTFSSPIQWALQKFCKALLPRT